MFIVNYFNIFIFISKNQTRCLYLRLKYIFTLSDIKKTIFIQEIGLKSLKAVSLIVCQIKQIKKNSESITQNKYLSQNW